MDSPRPTEHPYRELIIDLALVVAATVGTIPAAHAAPAERLRALLSPALRPGLALVIDTSDASLAAMDAPPDYDPAVDYAALLDTATRCDETQVYWRRGPGPAPDCAGAGHVALAASAAATGLHCARAPAPLATDGVFVAARLAQWDGTARGGVWREPAAERDGALECREDRAVHGSAAGALYASDGATAWSRDAAAEIDWDQPPLGDSYLLYSGHYLNYLRARDRLAPRTTSAATRRDAAIAAALRATPTLDVALLRLSHDGGAGDAAGNGGSVVQAFGTDPAASSSVSLARLLTPAGGPAPQGEGLVEALRVAAGLGVGTGLDAHAAPGEPRPSVPESRAPDDATRYRDPYDVACRAMSVALVAAGEPSADESTAAQAAALPGIAPLDCATACLAALAQRVPALDLRADLPDAQRPGLLWASVAAPPSAAADAARATGERIVDFTRADGAFELFARALQHDGAVLPNVSLTPPAWLIAPGGETVGAFVGLERPAASERPLGNLRRYGVSLAADSGEPVLVDRSGEIALAADDGQLVPGTTSDWSTAGDGDDPLVGGAAERLPEPAARQVFTDLAGDDLTTPANRVDAANTRLDAPGLGLAGAAPASVRVRLIAWLRGADVDDRDNDGDRDESSGVLAAPRADAPLLLRYGAGRERVLIVTRDGRVQVFDAATGIESWSYLPAAVLATSATLAANPPRAAAPDALAAEPRLHRFDANGDGLIRRADGDHLWLILGYAAPLQWIALDLTDADAPRRLWRHDPVTLPGMIDTATRPAIGRLRVAGATQNAAAFVVLLASGHDPLLDGPVLQPDRAAPQLTLVDAVTGQVLWRASRDAGAGLDLALAGMDNGFAAAPRLVDLDGDGFLDRGYAVDVLGRLWRLDIANGAAPDALVRARLMATLGASGGDAALARLRFHQEPDVSLAPGVGARRQLVIVLGSGNAARPRDTAVTDRLYALGDPGVTPGSAAPATVADADLVDVTAAGTRVPPGAKGWRLTLDAHGAGEKTAAPAVTLDGRILVTTWQPRAPDPSRPCHAPAGVTRAWTLSVAQGAAARVIESAAERGDDPRSIELEEPRWPTRTHIALLPDARCAAGDCAPLAVGVFGRDHAALDLDTTGRRTVWRDRGVDAASR